MAGAGGGFPVERCGMDTYPRPDALTGFRVPAPGLAAVVFALGPAVTVHLVGTWLIVSQVLAADQRRLALVTVLLVAWLPWPVSVPALWFQRARDAVRPDLRRGVVRRLVRSVLVARALLTGRHTSRATWVLAGGLLLGAAATLQF